MIERVRSTGQELRDSTLAAAIGVSRGQFSHKIHMTSRSKFSIEELGALADYFNAPPGWPLVPLEIARGIEKSLELRSREP